MLSCTSLKSKRGVDKVKSNVASHSISSTCKLSVKWTSKSPFKKARRLQVTVPHFLRSSPTCSKIKTSNSLKTLVSIDVKDSKQKCHFNLHLCVWKKKRYVFNWKNLRGEFGGFRSCCQNSWLISKKHVSLHNQAKWLLVA